MATRVRTNRCLAGWQFTVTDANNNPVGTITTSQPGTPPACVTVAAPGTYTVTETVQPGWTPTAPPSGSQTVTVQPGQTVNLTFGNQGKAKICILKYEDLDGDGVKDLNEPGLPGWQFTVSPPPLPPTTSPVTTGPEGRICFSVSAPGTYTITESVQSGWTPTTPTTRTVTVSPGTGPIFVYFGNGKKDQCITVPSDMVAWWPLDETSGTVANDLAGHNNQGTHQNGPTPIPGMIVSGEDGLRALKIAEWVIEQMAKPSSGGKR